MTTNDQRESIEEHLERLDTRLLDIVAEVRGIREELAALVTRLDPMMSTVSWVNRVVRHQVTDAHAQPEPEPSLDDPEHPPEPTRAHKDHFLCRWLGHAAGPQMGLKAICSRCGQIHKLGRGL